MNGQRIDFNTYQQLAQIKALSSAGVPDQYLYPMLQKALIPQQQDPYEDVAGMNAALQGYVAAHETGNPDLIAKYSGMLGIPANTTTSGPTMSDLIKAGQTPEQAGLSLKAGSPEVTGNIPANYQAFADYNPDQWAVAGDIGKRFLSSPKYAAELLPSFIAAPYGVGYMGAQYAKSAENLKKQKFGSDYDRLKAIQDYYSAKENP